MNVKENQIEVYRILDLSMNLPITQRIFGCGTIRISAKDVNLPQVDLKQIRRPHEVYNLIEGSIEEQKRAYGVLGRDIIGAAMHVGAEDGDGCDCDANGDGIPDHLQ